jgi:phosphatidylglycerol:prolipoprotein diacylglycerol transferase
MRQGINAAFIRSLEQGWFIPEPSLIWVIACLVVLGVAVWFAHREIHESRVMYGAGIFALLGAFWGGHFLVVLSQPSVILEDPFRLLNFLEGGKGVFGAFLGAASVGALYLLYRRQPVLAYADAAVPAVALGYAVARIGCFLNGDDFGTVSSVPWAVQFPSGTEAYAAHLNRGLIEAGASFSLPVHPTQLYHSAAGLFLFFLLTRWQGWWSGSRLALALAGYGLLRFTIEWFRGDALPVIGPFHASHLFSLAFIMGACLLWAMRGREQVLHGVMRLELKSAAQE